MKVLILLLSIVTVNALSWPFNSPSKSITAAPPAEGPSYAELLKAEELDDDSAWAPSPATVIQSSAPVPIATPKPVVPFTGVQYNYYGFKIRPAELKLEGLMLIMIALYALVGFRGRAANKALARAFLKANEESLRKEFSMVKSEFQKEDAGDTFTAYLSGRRAIESGLITLQTVAKHDLLKMIYFKIRQLLDFNYDSGENSVKLDFNLRQPFATPDAKFVFAICRKSAMKRLQYDRFDVVTFGVLTELSGSPDFVLFSESDEVTEAMVGHHTGIMSALSDGINLEYLDSLVISDMPSVQPDDDKLPENIWHLSLNLRLPPIKDHTATQKWISLALNISDCLFNRQRLISPLHIRSLKKRRTSVRVAQAGPTVERVIRQSNAASEEQFMSAAQREAYQRKAAKEARDAKKIKN